MPKQTLLDMTNNILSAIDSDEVNSISDTPESDQVVEVLKETYFALVDEMNLPNAEELFQLESATTATPTKMKIPDNVHEVYWVKYNKDTSGGSDATFRDVTYLSPEKFIELVLGRSEQASNVEKVVDKVPLLILNDAMPTYYTVFDNDYVTFDSYDKSVESNLIASKTSCHGIVEPSWQSVDNFVPDLPANLFSLLLTEAKSTCFFNIKQAISKKEEQKARRQRIAVRKNKSRVNGGLKLPSYGRR